ncbi:hypothetical protein [Streptomyces blastmyceticus]|uniref:hypothetical protein n=1 Tax=Streptomyces blastmyceticus TaxID=68180 RepID=UPI0031CDB306
MTATRGDGERVPGLWTKELLNSAQDDSFSLLRLAAGGELALAGRADDRVLVLDGRLSIAAGGIGPARDHRPGAYAALPGGSDAVVSSSDGALAHTYLANGRHGERQPAHGYEPDAEHPPHAD